MGSLREVTQRKLGYYIHKCSSYSTTYVPENIQENKSHDQSSRWSSNSNNPSQYLILKLQKVAIVKNITFGKYEKTHVCNLKKFKIYGGLHDENMLELLESGLKNNSTPETFELRHEVGGQPLPCRYIKIVPLQSWGPSFNFSIWFVELHGISDWNFVKPCIDWFNLYREREVIRHCLKHFRQMRYTNALEALAKETQVQLEDPHLTKLHEILVEHGDFQGTEDFMSEAVSCGMFNAYIGQQEYIPEWILMHAPQHPDVTNSSEAKRECRPGMRGGHQMCLDPSSETIYLFGGWDGNQDLSDMWEYHIPSQEWTLCCPDTSQEGGPSARSCHKFCLDPERRQIFTLGRYLDVNFRSPPNLKSDFYVYDIESNTWTLITEDTGSMGGPQLIYDHQMCMDSERRTIYVFGGRVLTPSVGAPEDRNPGNVASSQDPVFSGLYCYHVPTNTWKLLWDDSAPGGPRIKSRVGHSMLFHPVCRRLFIFAGQRGKEYLNDFYTLDVDTQIVQAVCDWGVSGAGDGPASGFTQRATIDPDLNEIYVLSGLSKDKEKREESVQNSFWVYYIKKNQWSCIYRNENTGEQYWHIEPCPRFAHQLVYDRTNKVHYLFGGNPGRTGLPKLRLDDFWRLRLCHPTPQQLDHTIKLMIRKYRFVELASKDRFAALEYLQTDLSDIIDHSNKDQTKEFQQLAAVLFQGSDGSGDADIDTADSEQYRQRSNLFHKLGTFFPSGMTQPHSSLIDLIPL
ncbi:Muskelin [Frankliniella fusca]|uniref:Muskelin n=1 Tax=Frankliniella fusca TaxID=407009 RepID=A0AAE1H080_9NEOP|nr:Muskelin [Frankliniella fusca]